MKPAAGAAVAVVGRAAHHAAAAVSVLAAVACAVACAGCGGRDARNANDPRVIGVGKAPGARAAIATERPCEQASGARLDPEQAEGTRIVEVCVSGASPETEAAVRGALRLTADKTLTEDALRRDLAAAYATGLVEQIEASAKRARAAEGSRPAAEAGSVLFLAVEERPRVTSVAIEGMTALPEARVAASLPRAGAPLDRAAIYAATQKLRDEYARDGWYRATVEYATAEETRGRVRLRIVVSEGPRAKVGKVTFEGARDGRDVALRKAIDLAEGAPLAEDKLERAALLVQAFYYDRGFVNVRVDEPKVSRAADGTSAITFGIAEGPVFRVRAIRVKGADPPTEKDILATVHVKAGEVFNRSKLAADLERIRARSRERGKPVNVEPETDLDAASRTIDVTLAVREAR